MQTNVDRIRSRRRFLSSISQGTLIATFGPVFAAEFGLTSQAMADAAEEPASDKAPLEFGDLEPLVCFMQETPLEKVQPLVVQRLRDGESLERLVGAAALANARTFGGEDYIGFHTFMALSPALRMSRLMPDGQAALPVLKVLFRNTGRIHEAGGRGAEVLHGLAPDSNVAQSVKSSNSNPLHDAVRARELERAEGILAQLYQYDARESFESLLACVQDNPEVHRTVLPYRAWEMQEIVGTDHAVTMLRQSVHYCVRNEASRRSEWDERAQMLMCLLDHCPTDVPLDEKASQDEARFDELVETITSQSPEDAAEAVATAIADGIAVQSIGEALSIAASNLVLRDGGRIPQWEDRLKPAGSVHGDSVGVHASDSANAWRNMAMVCRPKARAACLIVGAWQLARDRKQSMNLLKESLPAEHQLARVASNDQAELLKQLEGAIRDNLQGQASAIATCYGRANLAPEPIFRTLLKYAVSEDGALHAEKYFHTVWDDFRVTRSRLRWQHVAALARVTASEYGKPAAGQEEARKLLGLG